MAFFAVPCYIGAMSLAAPPANPARTNADTNAERQRVYRERNREAHRRWREAHRPKAAKHRMPPDNIGPAIAEGEPITDNLDKVRPQMGAAAGQAALR